jgi:hypothetical protein
VEQAVNKEATEQEEDIIYRNNRELFYSFDKEKKCYTRTVDYQYQANQVIIKQGWDVLEERINEIRNKVIKGELSPLAYFMEINQMEISMLAGYTGFRKWKIKRHLKPTNFKKITRDDLTKYASVLNVAAGQLERPDFLTNNS